MNDMQQPHRLVLIDRNVLGRDCLGRALCSSGVVDSVSAFGTVAEWLLTSPEHHDLAILVQRGEPAPSAVLRWDVEQLHMVDASMPVALVADDEDPNAILRALDFGIKGYIPSSLGIDIAFEAMRLVIAGGIFVPANSLFDYRRAITRDSPPPEPRVSPFTARQEAVIRLLRQGKSNKSIASELNMRESTVKVHIRNIMKVIKAKNRTEIAVRTARMNGCNEPDDR